MFFLGDDAAKTFNKIHMFILELVSKKTKKQKNKNTNTKKKTSHIL